MVLAKLPAPCLLYYAFYGFLFFLVFSQFFFSIQPHGEKGTWPSSNSGMWGEVGVAWPCSVWGEEHGNLAVGKDGNIKLILNGHCFLTAKIPNLWESHPHGPVAMPPWVLPLPASGSQLFTYSLLLLLGLLNSQWATHLAAASSQLKLLNRTGCPPITMCLTLQTCGSAFAEQGCFLDEGYIKI